MNVLDLFSGCGGISDGFRQNKFRIVGGIDFDKDSVKTFRENFPKSDAICADISKITNNNISERFANRNINIVVGGPPCQGFSNANRWQNEKNDPRNKLFFDFLRFVKIISPQIVLLENVRGILTKDNGYAKVRIINHINKLGYKIYPTILNASDFGVPQNRYRAFFVGIKKNILKNEFCINEPNKSDKVTVKDAIGELYKFKHLEKVDQYNLTNKPNTNYRKYLRNSNNLISNHQIVYPAKSTQEKIKHVKQGGNWRDIPKKMFINNRDNRHSSAYKRLCEKDVSVTIDTGNSHSNYFHPLFNRLPTVRESARIQSFKDRFIFHGSRTSQYRQVGNAVPPLLVKHIASKLKKLLI